MRARASKSTRSLIGRWYPYPSNIRPVHPASWRSIKLTFDDTRDRSVTSVPSPTSPTPSCLRAGEAISSERYRRFDSIRRYLATRQGAIVVSGNCYCAFEAAAADVVVVVMAAASLSVLHCPTLEPTTRVHPRFFYFPALRLNRLNLTTGSTRSFPSPGPRVRGHSTFPGETTRPRGRYISLPSGHRADLFKGYKQTNLA